MGLDGAARRRTEIRDPLDVVRLIEQGYCDEILDQVWDAAKKRELEVKNDLLAKVQEVYGPNATIVADGEERG